ncbi:MAG: putative toxin-antitoxin system toxin component, PIN family [Bryobacteraceae bacterium]
MRVTADTNVYISALNYEGPPSTFLRLAASGEIRLSLSDAILTEIEETLRNKFLWPPDRIKAAIETLLDITDCIRPTVTLDVVRDDPDDNKILECAQTANSDYIVTGDKHLLKLCQYDGTPIITVAEFLSRFRQADSP